MLRFAEAVIDRSSGTDQWAAMHTASSEASGGSAFTLSGRRPFKNGTARGPMEAGYEDGFVILQWAFAVAVDRGL